jgi:hypothetical protein
VLCHYEKKNPGALLSANGVKGSSCIQRSQCAVNFNVCFVYDCFLGCAFVLPFEHGCLSSEGATGEKSYPHHRPFQSCVSRFFCCEDLEAKMPFITRFNEVRSGGGVRSI